MAWGIALELYSAYGEHARSIKKKNVIETTPNAQRQRDLRTVGAPDPRRST
jgi:hypothetical protein